MSARRPLGKLSFLRVSSHLILNAIDAQQALVPGLMGCPQPLASRIMIAGSNECRNTHLRRERTWLDQILVQDQVPIRWTSLRAMERVVAYSTPWLHRRGLLVSCLMIAAIGFLKLVLPHTIADKRVAPGPGAHAVHEKPFFKGVNAPAYSIAARNNFSFKKDGPGPSAYKVEIATIRPAAPVYSMYVWFTLRLNMRLILSFLPFTLSGASKLYYLTSWILQDQQPTVRQI